MEKKDSIGARESASERSERVRNGRTTITD
jgi:hypothetical protein